jgi:hypothetical protein
VGGQCQLPDIVVALRAARRLAGCLYGGQEQCDKHPNNRDHNEQLNECKAGGLEFLFAHDGILPKNGFVKQRKWNAAPDLNPA